MRPTGRRSRTAGARFKPPQTPVPTVTYRGLFGPLGVDVDPEWIRETIPHFSPRSRCGRRLRRHLRLYEEHIAKMYANREASRIGPLIDEQNRIEGELEAVAKKACSLRGYSVADVALQRRSTADGEA